MTTKQSNAVTPENLQDIIDTGAYGGITYWAIEPNWAQVEIPTGKKWVISEVVDESTGETATHYLGETDVRQAYKKLLKNDPKLVGPMVHGYILDSWRDRDEDGIDCGHIDADAADVIIQVAIFGEVVYG